MKITVYCSARNAIDSEFFTLTRHLGEWMAHEGHTLVYGGSNVGLMEEMAKAVKQAGGHTIGVIPRLLEAGGKLSDFVDIHIPCEDLNDRKALMLSHADVAVALPGGVGTLDEVFTQFSAGGLGYHAKPVILYNMKGFWNPLLTLMKSLQDARMVSSEWSKLLRSAASFEELTAMLNALK